MIQNNLQSTDRVVIVVEAEDKDKAIEALNDKAIPSNVYNNAVEVLAHNKVNEMIQDEEDERRDSLFDSICAELIYTLDYEDNRWNTLLRKIDTDIE